YTPLYDKIKEARRQDDDAPQGEWRHERKLADWPLTIKLITEALSKKTKDLQLAAWLTEAWLRRDGIAGLRDGLDLIGGLVTNFWDSVYPELEDGDAEFRASPLQWMGDQLERPLKEAPLTRSGLNFYQYKESRAIGYEADAADNEAKAAARQEALAEGRITGELFDTAFDGTSKAFYTQLLETCDGVRQSIESLSELCDSKFGDVSPSFGRLRNSMDEVRQTVNILLQKKRERDPDAAAQTQAVPAPEPESDAAPEAAAAAVPAPARVPPRTLQTEPADRDDAVQRVIATARFLRREEPYSPAPYLLLRGLRWGELRAGGSAIDPTLLDPPPGDLRQKLKRLALDSNWTEVLETAETAMGMTCGRGWLDLQRYVGRACYELGSWYEPIALAVKSAFRALLQDYPGLPEMTLMDDTPTANGETLAWIREIAAPAESQPAPPPPAMDDTGETAPPDAPPDAYDLALQAASAGRPQEGIEILSREIAQERSGRGRFHRKVQLAQLCLSIGREAIARPILCDLAQEIEQRKLEEWETAEALAHPLTLLFRCLAKLDTDREERQRLYNRICRLDPVQAMSCSL
ncbi:MAG TPA: type VI secretion system protein TssA, partial [Candidatus Sulfopaludibacter sp.]|nr:type VI secretion system protein TssA [Candidatus Sulfopaludibacter sp.]